MRVDGIGVGQEVDTETLGIGTVVDIEARGTIFKFRVAFSHKGNSFWFFRHELVPVR